ncbi:MAG: O-sialoglycoprotein endopeptidase [Bacillota bacterium]
MEAFIGIDTSNYTTSVAAVCSGGVLSDERLILDVKQGFRGLRQSEALFQHVKNLPVLCQKVLEQLKDMNIKGIGYSSKPRPVENSYMPVFIAGSSMAKVLSAALDVPLVETTHQEGHMAAGIWSCKENIISNNFNAVHISGGTTEVLEITDFNSALLQSKINLIGGTSDLHAGQFVDRVGVKMGLNFPAGPQLELLARNSKNHLSFPCVVQGLNISFSGPESHAQRLLEKGEYLEDIARGVENCLAKTLEKLIINVYYRNNLPDFLIMGGVSSNNYLRNVLIENINKKEPGINIFFADPRYSSDNAVGIGFITLRRVGGA